jgi:hypothetical protein
MIERAKRLKSGSVVCTVPLETLVQQAQFGRVLLGKSTPVHSPSHTLVNLSLRHSSTNASRQQSLFISLVGSFVGA